MKEELRVNSVYPQLRSLLESLLSFCLYRIPGERLPEALCREIEFQEWLSHLKGTLLKLRVICEVLLHDFTPNSG